MYPLLLAATLVVTTPLFPYVVSSDPSALNLISSRSRAPNWASVEPPITILPSGSTTISLIWAKNRPGPPSTVHPPLPNVVSSEPSVL